MRQCVPNRHHDHPLIKGEVVGRHKAGVNVHLVAEPPLGIDSEVALEVGKVRERRFGRPA